MKILIVDDNEAIQEILSEILSVDGYATVTASSIDEAVTEIETSVPDAILLDSVVSGVEGLELIDKMLERGRTLSNIIVLTSGGEQIPKDLASVVGTIQKPFKSTEVLDKLREIFTGTMKERPKRSLFKALFGKRSGVRETFPVKFGRSYLFIEDEPDHAYDALSKLSAREHAVMAITSGKIKAARERLGDDGVKIIGLSDKDGPDYIGPKLLGSIMAALNYFISENERPVVMLDDLDLLIDRNGLNSVLTMIHQVANGGGKPFTLIMSARPREMTEKDRELLQQSMEICVFEE